MDETHHVLQYSPSSSSSRSKRPHHVHLHGHILPGRHRISRQHHLESAEAQWFAYISLLPEIEAPAGGHVPNCNCGIPCCLVLDEGSTPGQPCPLWVCPWYTCTFYQVLDQHSVPTEVSQKIHLINHKAEKSNMETIADCWQLNDTIGEIIIDGVHKVDRCVSLWYVLGWWGDSFSLKFFDKLDARHQEAVMQGNTSSVVYPKGSVGLKSNQEYDGFISYRWNSGRSNLTMSFLSVFGLPWVTFAMFIVYPILAVILFFGLTKPIGMFDANRLKKLSNKFYDDGVLIDTGKNYFLGHCELSEGAAMCDLFWFRLIGVFVLIPILLFSSQVIYSRSKYFLDRQVICQTDTEVTTFGIFRLPLYLKNSKTLYVFFDDKYVTRTWCMVELCFYLSLRKNPDVRFISIPHHKAGVALTLLFAVIHIGFGIMKYLYYVLGLTWYWTTNTDGTPRKQLHPRMDLTLHIATFIIQILTQSCMIYFGRQFFKSLRALKAAEDRFDVRKCECGHQNDLPLLLSSIDHFFGSVSIEDDSGIVSFNHFVRRSLREYAPFRGLSSCLILSYVPALIVGSTLSNTGWTNSWFNMLDNVAGNISQNGKRFPTLGSVLELVWAALLYGPLALFVYSVLLKLLWYVEQRFKWLPWYILYPCFVVFDIFVPVREWVFDSLIVELARAACETNGIWYVFSSPFWYVPSLFSAEIPWFEMDKPPTGKLLSLAIPIWGRVFVWIWLVFATLFTYMVYEPISWQRYRQAGWSWLRQKFTKFVFRSGRVVHALHDCLGPVGRWMVVVLVT